MTDLHTRLPGHPAPVRGPAGTARVVLVGAPGSLRAAVARELRTAAAPAACLDTPDQLFRALSGGGARGGAGPGGARLDGATVVFVTVPRLPGLASKLHRYRSAALTASFERAAAAAREHGTARIVVLSTAFRYDDDRGLALYPGAPTVAAAETAPAAAAEAAAALFARLGGDSVVLRLGWACGREDGITRRVLAAARRGWRLIDGDPAAWVPMIAEADAARAVGPALTAAPGTYNLTDGRPVTQGMLNARLECAAGQALHNLDDPRWGCEGTLFGRSRKITGTAFGALTGWRPWAAPAADGLAVMLAAWAATARR